MYLNCQISIDEFYTASLVVVMITSKSRTLSVQSEVCSDHTGPCV